MYTTYSIYNKYITKNITNITPRLSARIATLQMCIKNLYKITENSTLRGYLEGIKSTKDLYYTFKIPKKTGGFREINAPNTALKTFQTSFLNILRNVNILPHNAAHAYTSKRSHLTALKTHQKNNSKWFLKLDIKDFFPSCTYELIITELYKLTLFAALTEETQTQLNKLIKLCCLNNALPQGSPISPYLSNLILTETDYKIENYLIQKNNPQRFIYTRYADDILISSRQHFDWKEIETEIQEILPNTFHIKTQKTRYGSRAGRNWNLGLMLNQQNKITLGHTNKRNLKAALHNYIFEYLNNPEKPGNPTLQGQLSYAAQIEPAYFEYLINKYNYKYHINLKNLLKNSY